MRKLIRSPWLFAWLCALTLIGIIFATPLGAQSPCNVPNCMEQGGDRWSINSGGSLDVASGGEADIESGAALKVAGSDVTPELVLIDGSTADSTERNILDGATVTTAELNILDGVTATTAELNELDASAAGTLTLGGAVKTTASVTTDGGVLTIDGDVTAAQVATATFGAPNTMTAASTVLNQVIGIPKLNVTHTAALADGTAGVDVANPLLASCNAIVNGAEADDATNYITGSSSYKYTFASTAAENDGIDCVIAYPNAAGLDSVGFWFRTDTAIASGDLVINLDDGGVTDGSEDFPAVTVVDEWQWIEVDFNTDCAAECEEVDGFELLVTAQAPTNLNDVVINIDMIGLWIATSETAIGDIQVGGLIDLSYAPTSEGSANTQTQGVEWTHYFINYQSGADAIIPITNLSTEYATTLEALN